MGYLEAEPVSRKDEPSGAFALLIVQNRAGERPLIIVLIFGDTQESLDLLRGTRRRQAHGVAASAARRRRQAHIHSPPTATNGKRKMALLRGDGRES